MYGKSTPPPSDEGHEYRGLYKMVATESQVVKSLWDHSRNVTTVGQKDPGE